MKRHRTREEEEAYQAALRERARRLAEQISQPEVHVCGETVRCGGCGTQILPDTPYYYHLTGMVECVACYSGAGCPAES